MNSQTHRDNCTAGPADTDQSDAEHPFSAVVDLPGAANLAWAQVHAGFLAQYNQTIEREGLPLSEWRSF